MKYQILEQWYTYESEYMSYEAETFLYPSQHDVHNNTYHMLAGLMGVSSLIVALIL